MINRFQFAASRSDTNVIHLLKGDSERYTWRYSRENSHECLRSIGRCAANPDLSLTWHEAAILSKQLREQMACTKQQCR